MKLGFVGPGGATPARLEELLLALIERRGVDVRLESRADNPDLHLAGHIVLLEIVGIFTKLESDVLS